MSAKEFPKFRDMGPMRMASYPYCAEETKYEKLCKIGQGTFGEVFKARDLKTKELVAMKKILLENEEEGFPITAMREIKILRQLDCEHVVKLIEVVHSKFSPHSKSTFFLIFEFCEHDLAGLLSNGAVRFTLGEIKSIMSQLLTGLYFIHYQKILHRDMKAANILINKDGILKIADFGLARPYSDTTAKNCYTNRVVTLWYRPPELLLGERSYTPAIDMWGAGCIFAELWTRSPIMQGSTEQGQLQLICQLCGSITPEVWPDVIELKLYQSLQLPSDLPRRLKERLRDYVKDPLALDLIDKLLILDPAKRYDSDMALNHDFFWSEPTSCDLKSLMGRVHSSQFEYLVPRRRTANQPNPAAAAAAPRAKRNPDQHVEYIF